MSIGRFPIFLWGLLVALIAAEGNPEPTNQRRAKERKTTTPNTVQPQSWLHRYDLASHHPLQFDLPDPLREASGLAMTEDGRLFCHNDEAGVVYQVDYTNGRIVKRFSLGSGFVGEDFEGIAIVRDTFYLVTSRGNIFAFREGKDRGRVRFTHYRTGLSPSNDVEGLEFDPETNCLLLACKGSAGDGAVNVKAVYAFSLATKQLLREPRFYLHLDSISATERKRRFAPSGIARHPLSGTFFIVSADGACLIEVGPDGSFLAQAALPRKVNPAPEGIVFAPDLSLILCNDGKKGKGTLTLYPVMKDRGREP